MEEQNKKNNNPTIIPNPKPADISTTQQEKPKRKRNNKKRSSTKNIQKKILKLFVDDASLKIGYRGIQKKFNGKYHYLKIKSATNALWERGKLDKDKTRFSLAAHESEQKTNGHNQVAKSAKTTKFIVEGIVDMTNSGAAYIISPDTDRDIFIPKTRIGRALDGDRVRVRARARRGKGRRLEGDILAVLERNQDQFVGIIKISSKHAFLIPDNPNMKVDIFIPKSKIGNATDGDKVLVKIFDWPEDKKSPQAAVIEVLGKPGTNDVEMLSILSDNGFPLHFSDTTLQFADQLDHSISQEEIARRRDFRATTTFTIDPEDAKDFDDALSIQHLENGNWQVGIHIADVTHYAKPNTPMDREAYKRATSVYMVDRVLPMYPEHLSNTICSLRPQEDKLCFSAIFELDAQAIVQKRWFGKTIIWSDHRLNYEQAQQILDTNEGILVEELTILNDLAKKLRAQRIESGSINFGSEEVKFVLDETGKPVDVVLKVMHDSNRLIEDFMLLANREVAKFLNTYLLKGKNIPTVNRIHSTPDLEKLTDFQRFASAFGYQIRLNNTDQISESLNELLAKAKGKPEQMMLETLAIRTMAKACYSTDKEVGHYGLAFKYYAHFTSPIRRYPDVLTHRILAQVLSKRPQAIMEENQLEQQCEHCSIMERKALNSERASIKYKQVEYLSQYVGQTFEGIISGVKHFGFFVELKDNKCEGLVRIESLLDDHYFFEETRHAIIGRTRNKVYQLGRPVKVLVVRTDLASRTIDFEVVS